MQSRPGRLAISPQFLIGGVILILVFIMAARVPLDTDLWWHLRAGESTWMNGRVLLNDTFSYTRLGASWTNHSWLSQVILYLVYRAAGAVGISALIAMAATLSIGLLLPSMDGPILLKGFILVLVSAVASMVWSPRPQTLSLVFFSVVGLILFLYKWRGHNYLWNLVPLFILWANLHAGFSLGLVLIAVTIAGETANHLLGYQGEEVLSWKKIRELALWGLVSAVVVLANPNGVRIWLVQFQTIGVQALQQLVSEWASPDFHQIAQQSFLWLLFATVLAVGISGRSLDGTDAAGLVLFAYLALVARRNYGPFALVAAPVLSRHLWEGLKRWWERVPQLREKVSGWHATSGLLKSRSTPQRTNSWLNLLILLVLGLSGVAKLFLVNSPQSITGYESSGFPSGAVHYLETQHPQGRLFNSYNWGGYLLWNARDYPVFIDGRTDLYNDEIIGQWLDIVDAKGDWNAVLNRWNVRLILLEPDWPVVPLLENHGWKLLHSDTHSVLYSR